MRKDLYDVIEDFDALRLELAYYLKSNKSFIEIEISDNYGHKHEFLSLISGIEFTNQKLIERFEDISTELSLIMKAMK
jgi:hypothetical protein